MDGACCSRRDRFSAGKSFALGLWSVLILATAVLLSRRIAGALSLDLPLFAVACVTVIAACLSLLAYSLRMADQAKAPSFAAQVCMNLVTLSVPVALAIVLFGETNALLLTFLGILLAFSTLVLLSIPVGQFTTDAEVPAYSTIATFSREKRETTSIEREIDVSIEDAEIEPESVFEIDGDLEARLAGLAVAAADEPADEHVTQWMKRFVLDDCDAIEGALPIEFAAGQSQANVHLTFWPPFAETPELNCELEDGISLRLKISSVQPYGARVEAKRSGNLEFPLTAQLSFEATAPKSQPEAA